jgi:hypothetical protein
MYYKFHEYTFTMIKNGSPPKYFGKAGPVTVDTMFTENSRSLINSVCTFRMSSVLLLITFRESITFKFVITRLYQCRVYIALMRGSHVTWHRTRATAVGSLSQGTAGGGVVVSLHTVNCCLATIRRWAHRLTLKSTDCSCLETERKLERRLKRKCELMCNIWSPAGSVEPRNGTTYDLIPALCVLLHSTVHSSRSSNILLG